MDNPQGTLNVTDVEVGWLAGIVDGEGTVAFSVYKAPHYRDIRVKPQVIIGSTEKVMIDAVAHILGRLGVGVHFDTRTSRHPNAFAASRYKPFHVANVCGFKRVGRLLPTIIPHLVTQKRQKSEMVLRYIKQRLEKTAKYGRWASVDIEDAILMRSIVLFSDQNSAKGSGSRNTVAIERLLRDLEQDEHATNRLV